MQKRPRAKRSLEQPGSREGSAAPAPHQATCAAEESHRSPNVTEAPQLRGAENYPAMLSLKGQKSLRIKHKAEASLTSGFIISKTWQYQPVIAAEKNSQANILLPHSTERAQRTISESISPGSGAHSPGGQSSSVLELTQCAFSKCW